MGKVMDIVSGVGILIGIYLFLSRGDSSVKIIDTIAKNSVDGIKTLQGR
jgi:hypothetical protein